MEKQFNSKLVAMLVFLLDSLEFDFNLDNEAAQNLLAECLVHNVVFHEIGNMASYLLACGHEINKERED